MSTKNELIIWCKPQVYDPFEIKVSLDDILETGARVLQLSDHGVLDGVNTDIWKLKIIENISDVMKLNSMTFQWPEDFMTFTWPVGTMNEE